MPSRRFVRAFILAAFLTIVMILYTMLESIRTTQETFGQASKNPHFRHLEDSIRDLNHIIQVKIEQTVMNRTSSPTRDIHQRCVWRLVSPTKTTLESRQLYDTLPFDNPQSAIWNQGFDIRYNASQWTSRNKLKIILMPHSHCDPGWLNTFEVYFKYSTKKILNTVIATLETNRNYKFVWAEISFLSLWWSEATLDQQQLLRKLLNNKQLEIVTGGWVMNDEANTHYFAMLDQLIEGHQFIERNLGNFSIRSSWANDPFGYSPTMTYLLRASGIQHLAIQRVHYHLKKALAKDKQLELFWQQTWDRTTSTRLFTHILPFFSYDIPHSCGPNPEVCCQFDFKRGTDSVTTCSWGKNPVSITDDNVQERARLLLDQYRQKAQLYRSNVLLIPLGDDFRYRTIREAKLQFDNYDQLFAYMNQRVDWHVEARYGTLSDYFEELRLEESPDRFPSYMGDFFTYADRADHYWSGYYTSRAFFKRMDRIVQSYLRASEIVFSCTQMRRLVGNDTTADDRFSLLIKARRSLGLFQHHDGITGTARDHVVNNYGQKLLEAIHTSQKVLEQSVNELLFGRNAQLLGLNEHFVTFETLSEQKLLSLGKSLYIYNPTDQRRREIIQVLVDSHRVHVTSNNRSVDRCQVDPKWSSAQSNTMELDRYELLIQIDVDPYSIKEYTIHPSTTEESCPLSTIEYFHTDQMPVNTPGPFLMKVNEKKFIEIDNAHLSAIFSKSGALVDIHHKKSNEKRHFSARAIRYSTSHQSDHHSGAYLFIPNGNALDLPLSTKSLVRLQRGPLTDHLSLIDELHTLQYKLTNTHSRGDLALTLTLSTHLQMKDDTELALRFSTGIQNGAEFFTDLNGFQMIRRTTYQKLPLQGNVYPMPSMAYIEDDSLRLTILAGQPSGVACLKSGQIDVFLDRRLTDDDGRGLGQGVMDNRPIRSVFQILFEARYSMADRLELTGYPSLLAHHLSIELLYPVHVFHSSASTPSVHQLSLFPGSKPLPGDYHLVNLRTSQSVGKEFALIVRRFAYDCDDDYDQHFPFDQPRFEHFFHSNTIRTIEQTSLTLQQHQQSLNITSLMVIPNAELVTYRIRLL